MCIDNRYDMNVKTVTENGDTYRVYHIDKSDIDKIAVRMLTSNNIKGLLRTTYNNGELKFCITNMQSLYEFVHTNNTQRGKHMLLKLFKNMISSALEIDEYMLSTDKLMLNPREIYVDEGLRQVFMPYMPVNGSSDKNTLQCIAEIRNLCDMLLKSIDKSEEILKDDDDEYGSTEAFKELQKNADESLNLKEDNKKADFEDKQAYIVRKRTGEEIKIDKNIFKLGKDESYVDYCIKNNPTVSRNHADIVRKPDGYYLLDKGSLNHTFVNGKKLETDEYRKLEDGYLLQLADEVFGFEEK